MKIRCITLFDITQTNISNRRKDLEIKNGGLFEKARNQQSNFETLLQIISLRSQPENITQPVKEICNKFNNLWGKTYKLKKEKIPVWYFSFTISQSSVFSTRDDKLELLVKDCDSVPLIIGLEEMTDLHSQISLTLQHKNIHFEIENDESNF